ncbi:putative aguB [Burkholderia pseudomallei A79D]|nr:putative aguB [Burkholderia pseudomallei A79D]KGX97297.1 putative aguB [Burkholderia pseudomallei A79C]
MAYALRVARARARRRAAGELLRARRPDAVQLGRDLRRGRPRARHLSKDAYSGRPGLHGEILFHAGRHGLSRMGYRIRADRRRDLLGSMVSGVRAGNGARGRGAVAVPERDRQRAARCVDRFARALAQRAARACGREPDAGCREQSGRRRARRIGRDRVLRQLVHRGRGRRDDRRMRSARRGDRDGRIRSRCARVSAARLGRVPGSAAGVLSGVERGRGGSRAMTR